MKRDQLVALIEEVRRGRQEDSGTEWKRQWWRLDTEKGKAEFRKDIAALANVVSDDPSYLIVGLKDGKLFDAELPRDEAELQDILRRITPAPHVSFSSERVDGKVLTVIKVSPPFDPPYVTRYESRNVVFIRRGSSIETASRFDLDSFYKSSTHPRLRIVPRVWPAEDYAQKGKARVELTIPIPKPQMREAELVADLTRRQKKYDEERKKTGYPTEEMICEYSRKVDDFVESLSDRGNLIFWYCRKGSVIWNYSVQIGLKLKNSGTKPAHSVKVKIDWPPWLVGVKSLNEKKWPRRPNNFLEEPFIRPRAKPIDSSGRTKTQSRREKGLFSTRQFPDPSLIPPLRPMAEPEPVDGCWSTEDQAHFWVNRVLHAHSYLVDKVVRVLALPSAPEVGTKEKVDASIFCEEFSAWQQQDLWVQVVEGLLPAD